jgi:hypothetical protein
LNEDSSFARPGARQHDHRAMNVFDGLPLAFVGNDLLRN